jgi:hypothetical protein
MTTFSKPLLANEFMLAVRKALGIKSPAQRLIIDAQVGNVVKVYVQLIGTEELRELDLKVLLDGADVSVIAREA